MLQQSLNDPISFNEIKLATLKNNKAKGEDEIPSEIIKCSGEKLIKEVSRILNLIVENKIQEDSFIGSGILVTVQKQGKPKEQLTSLRPITLLNSNRKILSNITMNRIRNKTEEYIGSYQSGFRNRRSTTDIVWSHKWDIAKALTYRDEEYYILGIDLSQAFDTVDRPLLINVLEKILNKDEIMMIRKLLTNTCLKVRWNGKSTQTSFETNIGIPQGDGLSPILFTIYLEAALRTFKSKVTNHIKLDHSYTNLQPLTPAKMVGYADDQDFIRKDKQQLLDLESKLKDEFSNWNLKVNTDKTELIKISKSDEAWKTSKKLAFFLDDKKDIERRKQLGQTAMSKLWKIYMKGKKLKISKKVRVYNSYVKPVLTYNSSAWAVNKNIEAKIDAFHRKQPKRVIGIYYPNRISNKELYKKNE